jgi:hypothetical protein
MAAATEGPYTRESLEGMTTNERLFETRQFHKFDEAQASGNADEVRRILRSIYVDEPSIEMIVNRMIGNV